TWTIEQGVQTGAFAHTDYDFKVPKKSLLALSKVQKGYAQASHEVFDFQPGSHTEKAQGEARSKLRIQELQARQATVVGTTDATGMSNGHTFELAEFPREDQNTEYLVTSTTIDLTGDTYHTGPGGGGEEGEGAFECTFTCI